MQVQARDIGIGVAPPQRACDDVSCPFHGTLPVRGAVLTGQVVSTKMERSVVVQREYLRYIAKYERFEKRTSRYTVHAPPCLDLKVGDVVTIAECRPISKTKSFVIVEARAGELRIKGDDATVREDEDVESTEARTPPAKGKGAGKKEES